VIVVQDAMCFDTPNENAIAMHHMLQDRRKHASQVPHGAVIPKKRNMLCAGETCFWVAWKL